VLYDTLKFIASSPKGCHLQVLWLDGNNIGDEGMKVLCDALKFIASSPKGCHLRELYLGGNDTSHEGLKMLYATLKSMISFSYAARSINGGCYLRYLYVYGNNDIPNPIATLSAIEKMRRNVFKNTFTLRSRLFL
jgi:hypothetical protein